MSDPWNWNLLAWQLFLVVIYVTLGLGLFALAYLIIDKVTAFSLHKELIEDQNTALGIVLGAVFLGIAMVLAAAIH